MSIPADVRQQALGLDASDRAALAQELLASLDELSEPESEKLWAEEAERRLDQLRAGTARAIPADEVRRKAQALLR